MKASLDPFRDKLSAIEEDVYQVRNRSGQDPLNFPIKLNNKIAALGSTVQHGDGKPTASSYEVYNVLHGRLADEQAKLDHLLSSELPAVNKTLTDRKLAALAPTKIETPQPKARGTVNNASRRRRGAEENAEEYRFHLSFSPRFLRVLSAFAMKGFYEQT